MSWTPGVGQFHRSEQHVVTSSQTVSYSSSGGVAETLGPPSMGMMGPQRLPPNDFFQQAHNAHQQLHAQAMAHHAQMVQGMHQQSLQAALLQHAWTSSSLLGAPQGQVEYASPPLGARRNEYGRPMPQGKLTELEDDYDEHEPKSPRSNESHPNGAEPSRRQREAEQSLRLELDKRQAAAEQKIQTMQKSLAEQEKAHAEQLRLAEKHSKQQKRRVTNMRPSSARWQKKKKPPSKPETAQHAYDQAQQRELAKTEKAAQQTREHELAAQKNAHELEMARVKAQHAHEQAAREAQAADRQRRLEAKVEQERRRAEEEVKTRERAEQKAAHEEEKRQLRQQQGEREAEMVKVKRQLELERKKNGEREEGDKRELAAIAAQQNAGPPVTTAMTTTITTTTQSLDGSNMPMSGSASQHKWATGTPGSSSTSIKALPPAVQSMPDRAQKKLISAPTAAPSKPVAACEAMPRKTAASSSGGGAVARVKHPQLFGRDTAGGANVVPLSASGNEVVKIRAGQPTSTPETVQLTTGRIVKQIMSAPFQSDPMASPYTASATYIRAEEKNAVARVKPSQAPARQEKSTGLFSKAFKQLTGSSSTQESKARAGDDNALVRSKPKPGSTSASSKQAEQMGSSLATLPQLQAQALQERAPRDWDTRSVKPSDENAVVRVKK
ncbi:hypothetical protein LTR62_005181 [Meristemomyces frigidus]|uniref:Uncharacterized protein n=1 Tax=Meristemomyces frigidus TaxID=1508187 RepID=A0AAN7TDX8_9PEZI|nr:hypothetical protein LTR62_005181 [Meristemomyces frigidus]